MIAAPPQQTRTPGYYGGNPGKSGPGEITNGLGMEGQSNSNSLNPPRPRPLDLDSYGSGTGLCHKAAHPEQRQAKPPAIHARSQTRSVHKEPPRPSRRHDLHSSRLRQQVRRRGAIPMGLQCFIRSSRISLRFIHSLTNDATTRF